MKQYTEITFYNPRIPSSRSVITATDMTDAEINEIRQVSADIMLRNEIKIKTGYPIICSWCGVWIDLIPTENSHGICPVCAKIEIDKLEGRE